LHHGQDQTILPYTSLWQEDAANGELPSEIGTVQTPKLCKKPLSQFIIAPRAQASSAAKHKRR